MKKYLLSLFFLLGVIAISHAQYPACMVDISNDTAEGLVVGIQSVDNTPNECGTMSYVGSFDLFIPAFTTTSVLLGLAPLPAPPIRPFRIGCYDPTDPSTASWQINTCWNPACIDNDEPAYDIQFTYCGDYLTKVTICC